MGLITILEHRQQPRGPLDDYWYSPVYGPTTSGVDVGPEQALSSASVWSAAWNIAVTLGTLPLKVYRLRKDRGRDLARDHHLYPILYERPNRWMPAWRYRSTKQFHVLFYGNAFSQKVLDRAGRIRELVPLHPARVRVEMEGPELRYRYFRPGGGERVFPQDEVFHLTGLSPNGIVGWDPLSVTRETFGTTIAVERHSAAYFRNMARVGLILKSPKVLGKDGRKKLREAMGEAYGGGNAFSTAVLEEGIDAQEIGNHARDAQLLGTRTHQVGEIARIFNCPPHLLKDLSRATYSNIEQQSLEYVIHTIRPWAVIWEQTISFSLFTETEREDLYARHSVEGLLRGDSTMRAAFYGAMVGMGAYSINDVREGEDKNPVEHGDRHFVPVNWQPLDRIDETPLPGEADDEDDDLDEDEDDGARAAAIGQPAGARQLRGRLRIRQAFRPILEREAERIVQREVRAASRARGLEGFRRWMEKFYPALPAEVVRLFTPALFGYGEALAGEIARELQSDDDFGPLVQRFVRGYAEAYGARYARKSMRALQGALKSPDAKAAAAAVEELIGRWEADRAAIEGDRETVRLDGAIAVAIYTAVRVRTRWVALDADERCQALDGAVVDPGEPFVEAKLHPPLYGGCTCAVMADL